LLSEGEREFKSDGSLESTELKKELVKQHSVGDTISPRDVPRHPVRSLSLSLSLLPEYNWYKTLPFIFFSSLFYVLSY